MLREPVEITHETTRCLLVLRNVTTLVSLPGHVNISICVHVEHACHWDRVVHSIQLLAAPSRDLCASRTC